MSVIKRITVPKDNADDIVLVKDLFFSTKDKVKKDDQLIDLETSKALNVLHAPIDGYVEYLVESGDSVNIGETLIRIHDSITSIEKVLESTNLGKTGDDKESKKPSKKMDHNDPKKVITKDAQEFINKNNIDISELDLPFIKKRDVEDFVRERNKVAKPEQIIINDIETRIKPISLAKKLEISALSSVQSAGLVSTIFINVEAIEFQKDDNFFFNTTTSYLPIIVYETSKLLEDYPIFNSYFSDDEIREYTEINAGIAIDIDDGLKVYTIRNSNDLDLKTIQDNLSEGLYSYLRKTLTTNEITGSTFTITDLSPFGIDRFIPLINNMQSAILGIASTDKALNRFTLCFSYDHRVAEGKIASDFLSQLKANIEKYSTKNNDKKKSKKKKGD